MYIMSAKTMEEGSFNPQIHRDQEIALKFQYLFPQGDESWEKGSRHYIIYFDCIP